MQATYGAVIESIFLLRIGSDILANECRRYAGSGWVGKVVDVVVRRRNVRRVEEGSRYYTRLFAPL